MMFSFSSLVEKVEDATKDDGKFLFSSFDILTVLKNGETLLGSAGDEFDIDEDLAAQGIIFIVIIYYQSFDL